MPLVALGINHKTAPVNIRERLAFAPEQLNTALGELCTQNSVQEAAILSTCNRTELYCGLTIADSQPIVNWLRRYHAINDSDLRPHLYQHPDHQAVRHMLRVASGLDSMVLGEPQILGQVKDAYQTANQAGTLGKLLDRLFQHTFSVAKQVRTDTRIGESPVSVAFAAVSLSKQIFADFSTQTALLIGAGETIELVARHLHESGIGRAIVANRTYERAHELALALGGYAITLPEIPIHLAEADIVISSTASADPILSHEQVKHSLRQRKHRPIFMVDIAVPRDIDPAVAKLSDVYLYTVDDLQDIIQENLRSRQAAAVQAEEIIDNQVDHFMAWMRTQDSSSTIQALRRKAEIVRNDITAKALKQLQQGKPPEQVLEFLAHTLTNKLMHAPSAGLRDAAAQGDSDKVNLIKHLYHLDP